MREALAEGRAVAGDDRAASEDRRAWRAVALAVHPRLLHSVLEQVLRARGWKLAPLTAIGPRATAAVVSAGTEVDPTSIRAGVVVILPDEGGRGGSILFPGEGRSEPFPADRQVLGLILDLLERSCDP